MNHDGIPRHLRRACCARRRVRRGGNPLLTSDRRLVAGPMHDVVVTSELFPDLLRGGARLVGRDAGYATVTTAEDPCSTAGIEEALRFPVQPKEVGPPSRDQSYRTL